MSISPDPRVMDIYKLAVEMADRVSARRATANAFFLTVNTTLVAVVGLQDGSNTSTSLQVAVCGSGVAVAACWWFLLRNYRRLNEAKFKVINQIETDHLPVKLFTKEWALLCDDTEGRRVKVKASSRQLGNVERAIPVVFALLYIIILTGRVFSW